MNRKQQIADKIKAKLEEIGMSRTEFALAARVQPSSVTRWLSGSHNFTIETLFLIEDIIEIKLFNPINNKMKTYVKKPIKVRAVQFNYETWVYKRQDAYPMVESRDTTANDPFIKTREGNLNLQDGDYIIEGYSTEFGVHYWVNKPDYFKDAYEECMPS